MSDEILCSECRDHIEHDHEGELCEVCADNYKTNMAELSVKYAKLTADRDELRRVLQRCLMYGQLPSAIADEARKLLEACP